MQTESQIDDTVIIIVDDEENVRKLLDQVCRQAGYRTRSYASALRFLTEYDPNLPGCILLDLNMPEMDGLELQEKLLAQGEAPPILFITGAADVSAAVKAMKRGAFEFIEKPFRAEDLVERIHVAVKRDRKRREELAGRDAVLRRFEELTRRERQVLEGLVQGENTKATAYRLDISPRTVDFHRNNLMEKVGIDSLAELVSLVERFGVLAGEK